MRWLGMGCLWVALALPMGAAAQSSATPTPATPGSNPGAAATDAIVDPTRPTATEPPLPSAPPGRVQYSPAPAVDPASAQPQGPLSPAEIRELLDASNATAKATREAVDYGRVVPDLLTQILTKLDKLEDKLGKIEDVLRAQNRRR